MSVLTKTVGGTPVSIDGFAGKSERDCMLMVTVRPGSPNEYINMVRSRSLNTPEELPEELKEVWFADTPDPNKDPSAVVEM